MRLKQTESEYLLFIPPSQKERAKAINGRRWDIDRKCWVYPRNPRTYDALIAEFGDDLVENDATRPVSQPIEEKLNRLEAYITQIAASNSGEELQTLKETIATLNQEIAVKNQQISTLSAQLNSKEQSMDWQTAVKQIALEATDYDPLLVEIFQDSALDESVPVRITNKLEQKLRLLLKVSEDTVKFHDLITMARESEILEKDTIALLHTMRKHRNILVHEPVHPKTKLARVLLCLFATVMVLPELPE